MELSALSLRLRALSVLRGLLPHPLVRAYSDTLTALDGTAADFADRYGARIEAFMHATGNSHVCLRRGTCRVLGGQSVFAQLDTTPHTRHILLTAALDGVSVFRDTTPAHEQVVSGLATALAVASVLQAAPPPDTSVAVARLQADAFNHTGARRLLTNTSLPAWDAVVHLGHLGLTNDSLFVYPTVTPPAVDGIRPTPLAPPPSPLDVFPTPARFLIADHNGTFRGNVGTHRDVLPSIAHLCDNVRRIAHFVHALASPTAPFPTNVPFDCDTYERLFYCLAYDLACPLLRGLGIKVSGTPNAYPSIIGSPTRHRLPPLPHAAYAFLQTLVNQTENGTGAVDLVSSFGLDFDDQLSLVGDSGDAWTESNWDVISLSWYEMRTAVDDVLILVMSALSIVITFAFIVCLEVFQLV